MTDTIKPTAELILSQGYFPKELPPAFTTKSLAKFITTHTLPAPETTRPGVHNLARPGGLRRRLHLPNPVNYVQVATMIADHWSTLNKHFDKSKLSVSRPLVDESGARAMKSALGGIDLVKHRVAVRTKGRFVLRADISRFYSSIYTHSIPWAIDGKIVAKKVRQGGLGNELDAAMSRLQDGQTLGIPTGPDASLVVGEIIATAVDDKLQQAGIDVGMRYIDDYEFVFPARAAAEAAWAKLEAVLSDFELALNLRKTGIEELPVELDRGWNAELRNYYFPSATSSGEDQSDTGPGVSSEQLIDYFNKAFLLKSQNTHDPVLAYAVARLRGMAIADPDLLIDLICQCALSEHGALNAMVSHYEKTYDERTSKHAAALDLVINTILEEDSILAMGTEVSWALWAAICFKRKIPTKLAKRLDGNPDCVVAILALHARSLGLIKRSVKFPIWETRMRASSLNGPEWLLAYEADVKGWLPPAEGVNHVDESPAFSALKRAGVYFYDIDTQPRTLISDNESTEPQPFS